MSLPGIDKDLKGTITFSLTDEEQQEVQEALDSCKRYVLKEEFAEEIQYGMMSNALSLYAGKQIMISEVNSKNNKDDLLDKAIASISKAYSFCPLPIYLYDLAYFLEMRGRQKEANDTFMLFLKQQELFNPNQVQQIVMNVQARDMNVAIEDAKRKLNSL